MYATDTNVLKTTTVPLTGHFVHGVRLVMKTAHATEGVLGGHALYGVRSFKVMSPQMRTVLESCAIAAKSGETDDKYFAVAVGSFDPAAGSELPGLEAADAALAAAVTGIAEVVPDAHACKKKGMAFSKKGKSREGSSRRLLAQQNLLNKRLCLMRLSRRFCLPDASCKNKFVKMSAGFLVLAPGGTTQAAYPVNGAACGMDHGALQHQSTSH